MQRGAHKVTPTRNVPKINKNVGQTLK